MRKLLSEAKHLFSATIMTLAFMIMAAPGAVHSQNLLNGPESVAYDSLTNRYLVSCWRNGCIVEIDSTGTQTYFKTGLSNLLGNHLYENILYVSTAAGVLGFDITTGEEVLRVAISPVGQIDGLTVDDSGHIFVVDGLSRRIYKINIAAQTYTTFVSSGLPAYAQDCIFDREHNRLLVVAWTANAGIQAVSLGDSSLTTIVETSFGYFDGIARDQLGNVYVASHSGTGEIYRFDNDFMNPPELISSGHNEPAGLCYNNRDNILAVPNFAGNTISYIHITPTSVEDEMSVLPRGFGLSQNFPNPFNPVTTIKFTLEHTTSISLKIFDSRGKLVRALAAGETWPRGSHSVVWDGTDQQGRTVGSGMYFYKIESDRMSEMRKMVLLR